jgi:hypothetical protein
MPQFITINGDLIAETEKAWLVAIDGDRDNQTWLAKSQIEEIDPDAEKGDKDVDIVISEWYYNNKISKETD